MTSYLFVYWVRAWYKKPTRSYIITLSIPFIINTLPSSALSPGLELHLLVNFSGQLCLFRKLPYLLGECWTEEERGREGVLYLRFGLRTVTRPMSVWGAGPQSFSHMAFSHIDPIRNVLRSEKNLVNPDLFGPMTTLVLQLIVTSEGSDLRMSGNA